jgi:hypothetical protein
MTAEDLASWITALATCAVAVIAWRQLPLIARQVEALAEQIRVSRVANEDAERRAREWETLKACQLYDVDPVIDGATLRIWEASCQGTNYLRPEVQRRDIICLLNYLDGLATGIEQKLFIEAIIRDHLGAVFDHAVRSFIDTSIVDRSDLDNLLAVHARWYRTGRGTEYQSASQAADRSPH